jgi:transposase
MQTPVTDYKTLYEESQIEHEDLRLKYHMLQAQLRQMKQLIYGSKNERYIPENNNPSQLNLGIQVEPVGGHKVLSSRKIEYTRTTSTTAETKTNHPGRMKLPPHLERRDIIIELPGDTQGLKWMDDEITEELDYVPGKFIVNRYIRRKYIDQNGKIFMAPMIDRPIHKAIAGPGLLAQIVIDKYVDHLPLYRQQQRFARENINIPYSTITDMVTNSCKLIKGLYNVLRKEVIKSNYLHADESPIKVLDKDKKGQTHRGYFWVYHNSIDRLVLFDYQESRSREGPINMLKDFTGHLQTDGYAVYDIFNKREDVILLHCMAHARRMFYEALENDKSKAEYALGQIGLLYDIERNAKDESFTPEKVLALRQGEALPILKALEQWMKEQYLLVLPKSSIGKALGYSIQRWDQLMIYAGDGKLNIDNYHNFYNMRTAA